MEAKFINLLKSGDRRVLAQAITLMESSLKVEREQAELLLSQLPTETNAMCIGITGAPGVGKSLFIEAFGIYLADRGMKVAVLAIDPSSPLAGGAILADKTRMTRLSRHPNAFVRPSASGQGYLGGLNSTIGDSIAILEGANFDIIIVETIGVGQNETSVRDFVDVLAYLVSPAAGDELQAIKKGIMEVADVIVITKDDGDLRLAAEHAALSYASLTKEVPVVKCSSREDRGIIEAWASIEACFQQSKRDHKEKQRVRRFNEILKVQLMDEFLNHPAIKKHYAAIENQVKIGKIESKHAVKKLFDLCRGAV
jgi:LAO/AO transport system kinase